MERRRSGEDERDDVGGGGAGGGEKGGGGKVVRRGERDAAKSDNVVAGSAAAAPARHGLSPLAAAAAAGPSRSVAQAISCRPEDVRAPNKRNNNEISAKKHHEGSHGNYMSYKIEKLGEQNDAVQASAG
jgi:hypothetical protein